MKKNTLKVIEIFPTFQCNLECDMCSVAKFRNKNSKEEVLQLEDYKEIAEQGARLGAIAVTVLGGEPLLYKNLENVIRIFSEKSYYVYIVTNSLLLSEEKIKSLKEAGTNGICMSLDSVEEETNDKIRGQKGHYQKVMSSIQIAKDAGLEVSLAPVFFPGKIEDGLDVVRLCKKKKIGASGSQAAPVGGWEGRPILSEDENRRIRKLMKQFPRLTFDWALSYFLKPRCPGGKEKIAITATGDVTICSANPISFGNIRRQSIKNILRTMMTFKYLKQDSPVCLAAEHREYINKVFKPLQKYKSYPVFYKDHEAINPDLIDER